MSRAFVAMRDHLVEFESHPMRLAKLEKHSIQQTEFNEHVRDALRNLDSFIELVEDQLPEAS